MKNPYKDIIEAGDTVILGIPYKAEKIDIEKGNTCFGCDLRERIADKDFKGCASINCRHIVYKEMKGGI